MNDISFAIGSPLLFFSGSVVSLYLVYMIFHYIYDSLANHLIRRENLISYSNFAHGKHPVCLDKSA